MTFRQPWSEWIHDCHIPEKTDAVRYQYNTLGRWISFHRSKLLPLFIYLFSYYFFFVKCINGPFMNSCENISWKHFVLFKAINLKSREIVGIRIFRSRSISDYYLTSKQFNFFLTQTQIIQQYTVPNIKKPCFNNLNS